MTSPPTVAALDCQFTIVAPRAIEEDLIEMLVAHPECSRELVVVPVEAAGYGLTLGSARERVRGRSRQVEVRILLARTNVDALVEALRASFNRSDIVYWATPLIVTGSL